MLSQPIIPEQVTYFASTGESETLEFKETTGTWPRDSQNGVRIPEIARQEVIFCWERQNDNHVGR